MIVIKKDKESENEKKEVILSKNASALNEKSKGNLLKAINS